MKTLVAALAAALISTSPAATPVAAPLPAAAPKTATSYPFAVGERLEYAAKLGFLRLGTAWLSVTAIDTVRTAESFVFEFGLDASAPFYKSRNVMRSWTGTADLISRRFHQDLVENGKERKKYYDIFPDSLFYTQENRPGNKPTVTDPLDDAAFFYFLRTIPLEVGKTYTYQRYFRKEWNPVKIRVLKRERMDIPGGKDTPCIIINPEVGEEGVFAPRAKAMLWLTDDERHLPVQIRSKLPFGTVTLVLEKIGTEPAQP
jgi:hypothetical protein